MGSCPSLHGGRLFERVTEEGMGPRIREDNWRGRATTRVATTGGGWGWWSSNGLVSREGRFGEPVSLVSTLLSVAISCGVNRENFKITTLYSYEQRY